MNEYLLQYLWQQGLFAVHNLYTTKQEPIVVVHPGQKNTDAGPDFAAAKIKIGDTLWIGNVELHLKTSDWLKHQHDKDPAYQNIILHVVYEDDIVAEEEHFPTLVLQPHISSETLHRYASLYQNVQHIPCQHHLDKVKEITWKMWLDRVLAERWEQKTNLWLNKLEQLNNDWRTLLYYKLASNFGFKINQQPFQALAESIPLNVLVKHRLQLPQIEALLLGQSGLLQQATDDEYVRNLEKEYHFLRRKYQLTPLPAHHWKFLRLRPYNFPTLRIAQFAVLVHQSIELFAAFMEIKSYQQVYALFDIAASKYWNNHYVLGQTAAKAQVKHLGKDAIHNIIINTIAPMQYLYGKQQGNNDLIDNSIALLNAIPAERNNIIGLWEAQGIKVKSASDSQALLQLYQSYCSAKKCLQCAIGNNIMTRKT
jgi:hypothetical protein